MKPPGGNHRGSVFRLLVGNALIGRDPRVGIDSWSVKKIKDVRRARLAERSLEEMVSRRIGGMSVAFVPIEDASGPDSERGYVERNAIALLSGFPDRASDPPSSNWLGHHCDRRKGAIVRPLEQCPCRRRARIRIPERFRKVGRRRRSIRLRREGGRRDLAVLTPCARSRRNPAGTPRSPAAREERSLCASRRPGRLPETDASKSRPRRRPGGRDDGRRASHP